MPDVLTMLTCVYAIGFAVVFTACTLCGECILSVRFYSVQFCIRGVMAAMVISAVWFVVIPNTVFWFDDSGE